MESSNRADLPLNGRARPSPPEQSDPELDTPVIRRAGRLRGDGIRDWTS